ncbi:hypothetical protein F862_gp067 [Vibrio phage vB_VpaS_MAR10]|uniref:Uncharacterized protein n=1 Tax=Vibrio phage vB_VpaS_MAR10 TaxID=1229755 RepID=K7R2I5_9CAUD|nr:hypothetical protein F862_gp067 [Vibrio phage vB_VpaS_MAR10]AFV81299.1 hypothetical protein MAR10_065 [Vibrio phage vB_VpaS_MAR10]
MTLTKAILEELIQATNTPRAKRDSHEKHLQKIVKAVGALDDDAWDALSDEAAEWYNDAVNAINDGQDIPGSEKDPMEAEEEKPARSRRGRNTKTEETENQPMKKVLVAIALAEVVKGITATVVCGDDTFEGEVIAVTKKGRGKNATVEEFTLKTADGEEVFGAEDLIFDEGDKIERHDEAPAEEEKKPSRSRRGAKKDEEPAAEEKPTRSRRGAKKEEPKPEPVEVETEIAFNDIAKGDKLKLQVEDDAFEGEVKAVKKSGRGKNAKVAEFTLTTADGEEVFEADHIVVEEGDKIIRVTMEEPKAEAAGEEKKTGSRRGRGAKTGGAESAAHQVRRLICENMDADKKEIEELMAENGIDMKPSTFDVLYSEAHSLIGVLRELDKLA